MTDNLVPSVSVEGWESISAIAARMGMTRQTVHQQVKRFERSGVLQTRKGKGREVLVSTAAFLQARGEHGDFLKSLNANGEPASMPPEAPSLALQAPVAENEAPSSLVKEQTRRAAIEADLAQLKRDELLGKLVRVDDVERAMSRAAEKMLRAFELLVGKAETIHAAGVTHGVTGTRKLLKESVHEIREVIANEMRMLSALDDERDDHE